MSLGEHIIIDKDMRSGVPCVKGTRVPVSQILAELSEGHSLASICDDMELNQIEVADAIMDIANFLNRNWSSEVENE
jgi:uncharacterized protein (DUF433 family)